MMEMWHSKYFGGPVLNAIRRKDGTFMENNLKEFLFNLNINTLYGGGYYALRMIPDPENNVIYDIYILMEEITKFEILNKLNKVFDQQTSLSHRKRQKYENNYVTVRSNKNDKNFGEENVNLIFSDLSECLDGIARIISYTPVFGDCYSKDVSLLQIQKIEEG